MSTEDKALLAQSDIKERNDFIAEYSNFILSCASRAAKCSVDRSSDLYSEALIAFNDAVTHYRADKGSFTNFASKVIRNRIIDFLRSENRFREVVPFSALDSEDEHGDVVEFEVKDEGSGLSETAIEIGSLKEELAEFGINFFDLPASSPKSKKTMSACMRAIDCISDDKALFKKLRETKALPAAQIIAQTGVGKKIVERYRKYIIAGVLMLNGGYEILPSYLKGAREANAK